MSENRKRRKFVLNEGFEDEHGIGGDMEDGAISDEILGVQDNEATGGIGIVRGKVDDENIDIDLIAEQFAEFAKGYNDPKQAIAAINDFLKSIYTGNDYVAFTDIVRQNYIIIVQELLGKLKYEYERALLAAL